MTKLIFIFLIVLLLAALNTNERKNKDGAPSTEASIETLSDLQDDILTRDARR